MATRFSVWIDSPSTASDGNIQSYSTFANDSQRQNGFTAGTAASSIRMNSALRSATLVTAALMNAIAPNSTLDLSSSLADTTSGVLNALKNVAADEINLAKVDFEQFNHLANIHITDNESLTPSTVANAAAIDAIADNQNFIANGHYIRYVSTSGNVKYYSCIWGDNSTTYYETYTFDITSLTSVPCRVYSGFIPVPTLGDSGKVLTVGPLGNFLLDTGSGGMTNPMTSSGDIIYGGSSGTPTRLAKGTDGQVLTLESGIPAWKAATGGMVNPMTSQGDIIVGGSSGAPARLGKGTSKQLLRMNSGATSPEWDSGSDFVQVPGTSASVAKVACVGTDGTTVSWENASMYYNSGAGVVIRKQNNEIEVPLTPTSNYGAASKSYVDSYVPSEISYLTTAPSSANTSGNLKIVVLSSEPATKYDGYLYIITGS